MRRLGRFGCCAWCGLLWFACTAAAHPQQSAELIARAEQAVAKQAVAGRVLSAVDGHPVANATVQLASQSNRQDTVTVHTDNDGRYRFAPLGGGRYTLRASASGYLAAMYLEHEQYSSAIVLGARLSTEHLDFALVPGATLHGRIVDEAGEGVQRAQVMLYRERETAGNRAAASAISDNPRVQRFRGGQTDDDGRYDFADLQPGRYFLTVTATPWYAVHGFAEPENARFSYRAAIDPAVDVTYPETFYPGATTEEGAKPIDLRAGQRAVANVSLTPQRALSVSFRVPALQAMDGGQRFPMLFRSVFGVEQPVMAQPFGFSQNQTVVTMSGVPPGTYRVRTTGARGQEAGESSVTVSEAGGGVVDLSAAAPSVSTVTVHLELVGGAALPEEVQVTVQRLGGRPNVSAVTATKGMAELKDLGPGDYQFQVQVGGERWTVLRMIEAGKPVPSRRLRINGEASIAVDLLLTRHAPEIEAMAVNASHQPAVGAMVVLVPAGSDTGQDLFRRDQSDLDGGVRFSNVPPGNYLLVAIENGWKLRWNDTASLAAYLPGALPVVVPMNGPRTMKLSEPVTMQRLR